MSFIPIEILTIQGYSLNESDARGYVSWPTPPEHLYGTDEQACISTWHKQDVADSLDESGDPHQPVPSDNSPSQRYEWSRWNTKKMKLENE